METTHRPEVVEMRTRVARLRLCAALVAALLSGMAVVGRAAETTITYFAHISALQAGRLKPLLDQAEKDLGFKIDLQYTGFGEYYDKLTTMTLGSIAPDVVEVGTDLVPWVSRGLYRPLDGYLKADPPTYWQQMYPPITKSMSAQGSVYAVPIDLQTSFLMYNRSAFANQGLQSPPSLWTDTSWNWGRFFQDAAKLTVRSNEKTTQFGATGGPSPVWYGNWWGEDILPAYAKRFEPSQTLTNHLQTLAKEMSGRPYYGGDLRQGTAAMSFIGSWVTIDWARQVSGLDIAPNPQGSQPWTVAWADGLGIAQGSHHPQLAWKFIRWVVDDKQRLAEWNNARNGYGALSPIQGQDFTEQYRSLFPSIEISWSVLRAAPNVAGADFSRYNPEWPQISGILNNALNQAMKGEEPIASALAKAKPQINSILTKSSGSSAN